MYQKSSFAAWWINPNHSNGANFYIQISAIAYFDMDYWIFAILRKWWALNQINIIYNTLFVWKFSCSTFCSDLSRSLLISFAQISLRKKNRIWEYRRNQKSYFSRSSPLFITRIFSRTKQWNRTFFCFNNSEMSKHEYSMRITWSSDRSINICECAFAFFSHLLHHIHDFGSI